MGTMFRTAYQDGVDVMDSAGLDLPFDNLDNAIGNLGNHAFATLRAPLSFVLADAFQLSHGIIDVWHPRNSDGCFVHNYIAAATVSLLSSSSAAYAYVATLSDTNDALITASSATNVDDISHALNDKTKLVLLVRGRNYSGSYYGMVHYVGLKPHQVIRGATNLGTSTTKVVDLPSGINIPGATFTYQVVLTPTSTGWYALTPYVSAKTASSFTITCSGTPSSETFDWAIII